MNPISPTTVARVLGAVFALVGILGFVPNPLVGPDSLFATNLAHNLVHLITAALFFYVATRSDQAVLTFSKVFGAVYLLVGILGFITLGGSEDGMLLGVVHINQMDNYLHVILGIVIGGIGFLLKPASTTAA